MTSACVRLYTWALPYWRPADVSLNAAFQIAFNGWGAGRGRTLRDAPVVSELAGARHAGEGKKRRGQRQGQRA